jgi:DNA polymerase III alpha subunit
MPKRKKPEEKPDEQFKRFVETAREHGVDEAAAEKAFKKVASSSSSKKKEPRNTRD